MKTDQRGRNRRAISSEKRLAKVRRQRAIVRASIVPEISLCVPQVLFAVPRGTWAVLWRSLFLSFQDALNAKDTPRTRSSRYALSRRTIMSYAYVHLTKARQSEIALGPYSYRFSSPIYRGGNNSPETGSSGLAGEPNRKLLFPLNGLHLKSLSPFFFQVRVEAGGGLLKPTSPSQLREPGFWTASGADPRLGVIGQLDAERLNFRRPGYGKEQPD